MGVLKYRGDTEVSRLLSEPTEPGTETYSARAWRLVLEHRRARARAADAGGTGGQSVHQLHQLVLLAVAHHFDAQLAKAPDKKPLRAMPDQIGEMLGIGKERAGHLMRQLVLWTGWIAGTSPAGFKPDGEMLP